MPLGSSLKSRLIGPEDAARYDAFVAAHPKGHILQTHAWGQVKGRTGWRPLCLVLEDAGRIAAAALLLKRRLPRLNRCILYSPRGPVFDLRDEALFDAFLAAVREVGRREGAILWKIDPDVPAPDEPLTRYLAARGFVPAGHGGNFEGTQPRFVFRLDITPGLDELMASFAHKTRYNIRLAERRGVEIRAAARDELPVFYRLLAETAERDRFLIRNRQYFEVIWDELVERDYARVFLAWYQGEPIAGALALTLGEKAWYLYGASANRHREHMPNHLMQWTMIRWAKERGCTLYDFRGAPGTDSPDHPLHGLYRFKKGFNGVHTEFIGEYDLALSPLWYRLWNVAGPLYSNVLHSLGRRRQAAVRADRERGSHRIQRSDGVHAPAGVD